MNAEIEVYTIPEGNLNEDGLRDSGRARKANTKKRVRFDLPNLEPEPEPESAIEKFWLCQFYVNIQQDIPENFQTLLYLLYYLCVLHNIINLGNFLYAVFSVMTTVSILGTAIYCIVFFIYSYLVWFQCAYKTFTLKSKAYFMVFLVTLFLQFGFSCIQTVGLHDTMGTGFLSALEKSPAISSHTNYKMICELIIACVCSSGAFLDATLIIIIFNMYTKIVHFCQMTTPEDAIIASS